MNTPLGYNPVGESAPGLPRHDKQLPGHVSGQYGAPDSGPTAASGFGGPATGFNSNYTGPGLGDRFGTWSARIIMAFATYLTLPLQLVLYPIAAVPALAVGYYLFHGSITALAGYDESMSTAWTCAWLVLLPAMRIETAMEQVPGYRALRHLFRVAAIAAWFYYFAIQDQHDPPQVALLTAVIVAIAVHFFLRARFLRGLWEAFQKLSWLRKA